MLMVLVMFVMLIRMVMASAMAKTIALMLQTQIRRTVTPIGREMPVSLLQQLQEETLAVQIVALIQAPRRSGMRRLNPQDVPALVMSIGLMR